MSQGNGSAKKQMIVIQEAKDICCNIFEAQDFAFINKVQLALILRHLLLGFLRKEEMFDTAMARVEELETKYEPKEEPKEGGQG